MQYVVSFSSALKNIHSGVGAYGSCVVRLYLLRVMKSEMFACVEKKELTQAGEEAFFLHSRKHTLPIMHLAAMSWPPVHITIMISEETEKEKSLRNWPVFHFHPPASACPLCSSWPEGMPSSEPFLSKSSQRPHTNLHWQKGLHWPQAVRKKEK